MNPDSPDQTLARLFEQQRAADQVAAPSFARQCRAARPDAPRLRRPFLAALVAIPALVLTVLLVPSRRAPAGSAQETTLVSAMLISTWQPATDSLLENYANVSSPVLPVLGASWTDQLLTTATAGATESASAPAAEQLSL